MLLGGLLGEKNSGGQTNGGEENDGEGRRGRFGIL